MSATPLDYFVHAPRLPEICHAWGDHLTPGICAKNEGKNGGKPGGSQASFFCARTRQSRLEPGPRAGFHTTRGVERLATPMPLPVISNPSAHQACH
jgi:hypothetical protein